MFSTESMRQRRRRLTSPVVQERSCRSAWARPADRSRCHLCFRHGRRASPAGAPVLKTAAVTAVRRLVLPLIRQPRITTRAARLAQARACSSREATSVPSVRTGAQQRRPGRRRYDALARPRRWLRTRSSSAARCAIRSSSVISCHTVDRREPDRRTRPAASSPCSSLNVPL
jgi:hypothetical protein